MRRWITVTVGACESNFQLISGGDSDSDEAPHDDVRLWEDGWKERYYQSKFEVSCDDYAFRRQVAWAYAEGLCWVLQYYYQVRVPRLLLS